MKTYTRRHPFFMLQEDERRFSSELLLSMPNLRFVDRNTHWPPLLGQTNLSIHECKTKWVFLWRDDIIPKPEVFSQKIKAGQKYGYVLILERSSNMVISNRNVLCSGILHYSIEIDDFIDDAPIQFANTVLEVLEKQNSTTLSCISPNDYTVLRSNIRTYITGQNVLSWCQETPNSLLKDRNAPNYYWPSKLLK